jgi:hypothetical protein
MTILGDPVALKSIERVSDPTRGPSTVAVYTGTIEALNAVAATSSPDQVVRLVQAGPLGELTISTADYVDSQTSSIVIPKFELLGNDIQKSLYTHPRSLALGKDSNGIEIVSLVKQKYEYLRENNKAEANKITLLGDASELFDMLLRGETDYVASQYVFRLTQTVSSRYSEKVVFSNVDRVYSTLQLLSETNPPASLVFSVAQIPVPSTVPSGYNYGWLKKTPTVLTISGNKIEITLEYWREIWSAYAYPVAVTA